MKNIAFIIVAIVVLAAGGYWFVNSRAVEMSQPSTEGDKDAVDQATAARSEAVMEAGTYTAETSDSSIAWTAGKPAIAGYVHHGTFALQSGSVSLAESGLSGEFVIDINSLKVTSLGGGKAGQESALEGHLKTSGFFDAANYPTATFRIIDATPHIQPGPDQSTYTAKGELTMKGQTHEIEFPMNVSVAANGEVTVTASLELDRTLWDINFGSAKVVDQITDQVIGDTVGIDLDIKLQK